MAGPVSTPSSSWSMRTSPSLWTLQPGAVRARPRRAHHCASGDPCSARQTGQGAGVLPQRGRKRASPSPSCTCRSTGKTTRKRCASIRAAPGGRHGAMLRAAVEDWPLMRERAQRSGRSAAALGATCAPELLAEWPRFLTWLRDDHFILLGARDYVVTATVRRSNLELVDGTRPWHAARKPQDHPQPSHRHAGDGALKAVTSR